ncbi:MAG: M48 family metalloprotease, partial [Clostridia bacterium]|nr:M48 family metalloprotease [Clostridia bacterium]
MTVSRPRDRFPTDWQLSVRMLVTMLLLAAVYLLFAVVLWQAGAGATTVALFLAAMLLLQYTFSDRLVLWSMGAQLVDERQAPELHAAVARLAALAGLPRPRVAIVPTPLPNAFATGRDPRHAVVAVTTGLLQRLEPDELEAVLAHEVTHIRNRDVALITFASFFATLASYIVQNWFFLGYGMGRGREERGQNSAALVYFVSLL